MAKYIVVFTTVASARDARKIAGHLVKKRVAACVNVVSGVKSTYWWEKRLCRDKEFLLIMKTTGMKWPALKREVKKVHPYELPELIALPITAGSKGYLGWVSKSVK